MTTNSTAETAIPLDLSLYLVTGENPVETVRRARHATCIQVRSKPISARDLYALAEEIARIALPHQKILIDDRADVALALRARGVRIDGVHIGQDDLPVADARLCWAITPLLVSPPVPVSLLSAPTPLRT